MTTAPKNQICPRCTTSIPPGSPEGLCPRCLADTALGLEGEEKSPVWPVNFTLGQRFFGDFELIEELGRGGSGVVFKARQFGVNRIVAIKILLAGPAAGRDFVHRFHTEAAAAARLDHPQIVPVYEFGEHEGAHYLAMQFMEAGTLLTRIARKPFTSKETAKLMLLIVRAIEHAHQRGVLHRDLKPANILLDSQESPHVGDFGLARVAEDESALTLTRSVLGTIAYLAPEVAASGAGSSTTASDVYGLGTIFYQCLTNRPPFEGENIASILKQVIETDPVAPRTFNESIPSDLQTLCMQCLEKNPGERYASASELADDLERFLNDDPIRARPVGLLEKTWRWSKRKPALAALAALSAILLLSLAIGGPLAVARINKARSEAEANLYAADMNLASQALENSDLRRSRELLDKYVPGKTGDLKNNRLDRRGWEWRFLNGRRKGDELETLTRGPSQVSTVCFSADGSQLFAGIDDGTIRMWDFQSRRELPPLQTFSNRVTVDPQARNHTLAVSPDGRLLASAGPSREIIVWEIASRQRLATLTDSTDTIRNLEFSPDSSKLAAAAKDGRVGIWNVAANPFRKVASVVHGWEALRAVFSPDGRTLATSGSDRYVRLWELGEAGEPRALFPVIERSGWVFALAFLPGSALLAAPGGGDGLAPMWDVSTQKLATTLPCQSGRIRDICFSPDGSKMATCGDDFNIWVWNRSETRERLILKGHEGEIYSIAFSKDGKTLVSGSRDGSIRLWDVSRFEEKATTWLFRDFIGQLAYSPDGRYLAGVCNGNKDQLKVWDGTNQRETAAVTLGEAGEVAVSFSHDNTRLVVCNQSRALLLSVPAFEKITNFSATTVAFAPGHGFLVLGRDHQLIRRDDSGAEVPLGSWPNGRFLKANISPDGQTAAAVVLDSSPSLTLWDTSKALPPRLLQGNTHDEITGIAFSPDGRLLASSAFDGRVSLWDARNGQKIALFRAHLGAAWGVGFSTDGRTLASSGDDSAVQFWNLATLQQAGSIRNHKGVISCLAFSPDGVHLATAGNRMVRFWEAPSLEQIEDPK